MAQKVIVSEKEFLVEFSDEELTTGEVNGESFVLDLEWLSDDRLHIIKDNRSYEVEFLQDQEGKRQIRVNGNVYGAEAVGRFDELLKKMGMHVGGAGVVSEITAPMPGMVLEVAVKSGDTVAKGDRVLVLEAMKMENVIKSPTDGKIAAVEVEKGQSVDKNAVMIRFE